MDIKRLVRIISDRWLIVLIGAAVGLISAILFVSLTEDASQSVYEATAAVRFDPGEGQTIPDLANELRAARDFAVIAAEEQLAADPTAQITMDLAEATLMFTSQGQTEAEAGRKAQDLLQSYLAVDPEIAGEVDDELASLEEQASSLDQQIQELQPTLTPEQQQLIDEQTQLDQWITSINGRLSEVILAKAAAATNQERELLDEEQERLEVLLSEYRSQRDALGPVPVAESSATDQLLLDALTARQELLYEEYERLYLRKLGVAGLGTVEGVTIEDFVAQPIDPIVASVIAVIGGALIAAIGLMMVSKTRGTVWLPHDIDLPVLGQVPARPAEMPANEVWYDEAELGPRKTAVQALRSAVQAYAHSSGSTIALTGHHVGSEDLQALAVDLAGSMATAGESVLLIDANFESRSAIGQYRVGGNSLADILHLRAEAPDSAARVDMAVEQAQVIRSGLAVIPSGPPPGSPADALAGRQFRSLITAAERTYDTIIVVVDDFGTPASQVAMQRIRHSILVTSPGLTTEAEVTGLLQDADRMRISIVGAVFIGTGRRMPRIFRPSSSHPPAQSSERSPARVEGGQVASPMTRLHNYSIPDDSRSALIQHSPLADLATSFGLSSERERQKDDLGEELLTAVQHASGGHAYEAVAHYAVARVEDLVTARHGYGNLLEPLIEDVSQHGFLSLQPLRGHRTVGAWLVAEIAREVDPDLSRRLVAEMQELLVDGDVAGDSGFDAWLDREFFRRHLERTNGEPEVWQLVSPERAVSILVPARRLNVDKLESIVTEVASISIDELERRRKEADSRSDLESAADYEQRLIDVRTFESMLDDVLYGQPRGGGQRVRSVIWDPDWSAGLRANLVPFQRRGLLPFDVLSDEEIAALMATA